MVAEVVSAPALPAAPVGRMLDRGLAAGPAALSASPAGRSWSTGQTTGPGSRRTEEGGGAAGVSRGSWGEGGGGRMETEAKGCVAGVQWGFVWAVPLQPMGTRLRPSLPGPPGSALVLAGREGGPKIGCSAPREVAAPARLRRRALCCARARGAPGCASLSGEGLTLRTSLSSARFFPAGLPESDHSQLMRSHRLTLRGHRRESRL